MAGTSGYSYAPWKGSFYPEKTPAAKMLGYYATRLPTVEINNTFYRMPRRESLASWGEEVPGGFRFALKAPKRITHDRRLAGVEDSVDMLFSESTALGEKLGPVLFQLPPFFRNDLARLETFLALVRDRYPQAKPAFEFRHESWFVPEVYAALERHGAALCIADVGGPGHPAPGHRPLGLSPPPAAGLRRSRHHRAGRTGLPRNRGTRPTSSSNTRTKEKVLAWRRS